MTETEVPAIDPSVPRMCIYQAFEGEPGPCPRCEGVLHQQYQTYAIATRRGNRLTDTFMIGSDFGWFCEDCPTEQVRSPVPTNRRASNLCRSV